MRFVTETRMKRLEELIRSIPDPEERSHALHLLESIRHDIERNYAEIEKPIRLQGFPREKDRFAPNSSDRQPLE